MSAKFSPGPWRWVHEDNDIGGGWVLRDANGEAVLDAVDGVYVGVEPDDARLIAAAPEMRSLLGAMPRMDLFQQGSWSERDVQSYRAWVEHRDALFAHIEDEKDRDAPG